ncbi:uncharacterized protein LOC129779977 [Toxorhynchites rutilus septentrionalis]|uniref:uncharacterized protein LOC129779977 n=1 Tax=Toxorhynchites rutilus septentrionalis TaxID=329112 RepID=UPI00247853F4|nr:uncharacterized protein LOC129779977 [Toxorhynchites rutilus septentrionalis]
MAANAENTSRPLEDAERGNCANCSLSDSFDNFVQCDQCDAWWHMQCAGVDASIANQSFVCKNCTPHSVSSHSSSNRISARVALKLKLLEEQNAIELREIEIRKEFLRQKYALIEQQIDDMCDNTSQRSKVSRRSSRKRVEQWIQDADQVEGADVREKPERGAASLEQPKDTRISRTTDGKPPYPEGQPRRTLLESQLQHEFVERNQQSYSGAIPKAHPKTHQTTADQVWPLKPIVGNPSLLTPPVPHQGKPLHDNNKMDSAHPNFDTGLQELYKQFGTLGLAQTSTSKVPYSGTVPVTYGLPTISGVNPGLFPTGNHQQHCIPPLGTVPIVPTTYNANPASDMNGRHPFGNAQSEYVPTPSQLAARQVMPRDLPTFSGNPVDWPIFISSFINTTQVCGYSSAENLSRIQRCLKGAAYEAVKSRLLLPETVPQVLNTLQLLYGRPELLINALLDKVRSVPAPKSDKLETLIDFGMAVQSLCDHLEAAGQRDHLSNPSLLMELVTKLPAHIKMEWASFSLRYQVVNLKTFGEFMTGIVSSVSRVTLYSGSYGANSMVEKPRSSQRGTINAHVDEKEINREPIKLCCICKRGDHRVYDCGLFKSFSVDGRWKSVQRNALCRSCLNAHGRRSCRTASRCGIGGCEFRHHKLLHSDRSSHPENEPSLRATVSGNYSHGSFEQSLLFRIVPVKLYGSRSSITTFAFLDEGSSITLIEEKLVNELGVKGRRAPLCLSWTGDVTRMESESKKVELKISGLNNERKLQLEDARTVKKLALHGQSLCFDDLAARYGYLRGLPVASYENASPRLLIGIDNLSLTVPLKMREGKIHEPVAVKTRLGWCVYGGKGSKHTRCSLNYHACDCACDRQLHDEVKEYFALEDVGTKVIGDLESAEDRRARNLMEQTTRRVNGRFQTGLLWRYDVIEFPDSFNMALRRLECLERRMARDPLLKENLQKQLVEYQEKGYAHRACRADLARSDTKRVWYLPLGAVRNPKKPEKIRLIWDAAATVNGVSLNSMLLKGPDQLTSLPAVLSRFRQFSVGVSADIKEMFHQIIICEADRHSQRFLWRTDPTCAPEIYLMNVATFGATCSPASAQYIKNTNAKEFVDRFPRAVQGILHNHYVDDFLDSFENEETAAQVSAEVRMIHSQAGFQLRNWQSNSKNVLARLGEPASSGSKTLSTDKTKNHERVLGMLWLTEDDELGYSTHMLDEIEKLIMEGERPTKRQMLKCLMGFFDPLGLLSMLLVHGKVLLQDVWRAGTQWDQKVDGDIFERWNRWICRLQSVADFRVPRCYFLGATTQCYNQLQLHIFVDASEVAYSALAYFRIINDHGVPQCTLVAAKTKVAPLKQLSIPRLELQAAVLGTRLMLFVMESHTVAVTRKYLWSDSATVLAWIRSDHRRYKQFVACRIGEILTASNVDEWKWVPSKQNPADQATKWGKSTGLDSESVWFRGPEFLRQSETNWPQFEIGPAVTEEELRPCHLHRTMKTWEPVIDCHRFSKWERLLRSTAYVWRFIANRKREQKKCGILSSEELQKAEITLLRMAQWQVFPDEIALLEDGHQNEAGVLRMDGRIGAAIHAPEEMKFPVILPRNHRITLLLVNEFHRRFRHANAETVVNELRQRFYIPQIRSVVRKETKNCQWCKIRNATPRMPRMAPLPSARLASCVRPFTYTGLDFFGPLMVKVGRSSVKRWIALFTCLTVRAVHVEVAHSLSTDSCVKGVRRFLCRRGFPAEIYSDNGTNFQGAERILKEQLRAVHEGLAATFTSTTTKWIFIPPAAPHMGGAWERMVRSVKTAMITAYNNDRKLDEESLQTFVIEAESIVNSRPLTYLPLDSGESEALTPNHLLLGSSTGVRQPSILPTDSAAAIRNTWNQIQHQLDIFWRRWIREYLPTLTKRTKWFGDTRPLAVGDLVLVVDEAKRNSWERGRVLEIVTASDGRVRQATIQTLRGLLRRPVSKLAVLDVA